MDSIKSNNTLDIEVLTQKLSTYKQTLETLKSGNVVEDYILMKNESSGLRKQVSKVEETLKLLQEKSDVQLTEYRKKIDYISDQFETIHQSLNHLKEQVALLTSNAENINIHEFLKTIGDKMDMKNEPNSSNVEKNEVIILKEEIAQLKKQLTSQLEKNSPKTTPNLKPSSFHQLKNMIQSSKYVYAPLNSQRSMTDDYGIQGNQFQPTQIIKRRTMINPIIQQSDLHDKTVASKKIKDDEVKQQQENSPLSNQDDSTSKHPPASSIIAKTDQPNEIHENISKISIVNEVEDKEDTANKNPDEQFMKSEENKLLFGQETLEHSTVQLTSEPIEIASRSSDKGEEIVVEEKPSFLSFLQISKYFGK